MTLHGGARIRLDGVSIDFPLYHGSSRSLKKTVLGAGRVGRDGQQRMVVQALRDVSLSLRAGDRLGLVGANGAGKTTLLRTLAGIYEPGVGRIEVDGRIDALLDTGLGMNPELTGRENIMLRGMIAGLGAAATRRLEEDVRDFAELGQFMDLPVRIFSAGMVVRLGFALATAVRPQILLMDEWFLTGDAAFIERARLRLEDMVRGAEILVLSSHNTGIVRTWCDRVIWMDQGRAHADGPAATVIGQYLGLPAAPEPAAAVPAAAGVV